VPIPQEIALMHSIREKFNAEIQEATAGTLIVPEFMAALIANESNGDPTKKRFEKNVLLQLWEVSQGRAAAFGSIRRENLMLSVVPHPIPDAGTGGPAGEAWRSMSVVSNALQNLDSLATSWGLTQIMGYESIALGFPVADLQIPGDSLHQTQRMLSDFAAEFKLNPQADFAQLFDCWNTGRPHAATADPQYIVNATSRMQIYRDLPPLPPQAISA
jgi:hypothetical protein